MSEEKAKVVNTELKKLIECPSCESGYIVHVGDHYYCTTDKRLCGWMLKSNQYGLKITKGIMRYIVSNGFNEPMGINMKVFNNKPPVDGFIVTKDDGKIGFSYSTQNPVCACPKCQSKNIVMRFSHNKESYFYACEDWKSCKLTLPFIFRNKAFYFKDIQKLCEGRIITKEFKSKADKKYTANVFLNEEWKFEAQF